MADFLRLVFVIDLLGLWMYGSDLLYKLLCQYILRRTPTGGARRGPDHTGGWQHVLPDAGHALGSLPSLTGLTAAATFIALWSFSRRISAQTLQRHLVDHEKRHRLRVPLLRLVVYTW